MSLNVEEMINDLNAVGITVHTIDEKGMQEHAGKTDNAYGINQEHIFTVNAVNIKVKDELPRVRKELGKIEDLANSIMKFGQIQPIVINREMELIAGGRRLAACVIAGIDPKVCYMDAIDPLRMRELELEENLQREALSPSEEVMAVAAIHALKQQIYGEAAPGVVKDGKSKGWGLSDTASLMGKTKGSVAEDLLLAASILNFPELEKCKTKSEMKSTIKGMERVAQHMEGLVKYESTVKEAKEFVICNRSMENYITGLPDSSIDLLLTDPPYGIDIFEQAMGIGGETGGDNTTSGFKYEDTEEYAKNLLKELAVQSFRVVKPTGHAYIFCAPSHFWWLKGEMEFAGWNVRERPIVWIKRESGQNNYPSYWPSSAYEFILFARKADSRLVMEGRIDWIQVDPVLVSAKIHQAEKPVALLKELIQRTCIPGQYILDPFMGSGSTIEAAADMKMLPMGCEIGMEAYASAVSRMVKWKEKKDNGSN